MGGGPISRQIALRNTWMAPNAIVSLTSSILLREYILCVKGIKLTLKSCFVDYLLHSVWPVNMHIFKLNMAFCKFPHLCRGRFHGKTSGDTDRLPIRCAHAHTHAHTHAQTHAHMDAITNRWQSLGCSGVTAYHYNPCQFCFRCLNRSNIITERRTFLMPVSGFFVLIFLWIVLLYIMYQQQLCNQRKTFLSQCWDEQ